MGDLKGYQPPEQEDQLSRIMNALYGNIGGATGTSTATRQGGAAADVRSGLNFLQNWGPQYSQANSDVVGRDVMNTALNNALTDQLIGQSFGPQQAALTRQLDIMLSPQAEMGRNIDIAGKANTLGGYERGLSEVDRLFSGLDPNRLSGSEMSQIERGVNRLNLNAGAQPNIPSATQTASNAMMFGSALQGKQQAFANMLNSFPNMLGTGAQFAGNLGTGYNAANLAKANMNPQTPSYGLQQLFGNIGSGREAGTNLFNSMLGASADINKQRQQLMGQRQTEADIVNNAFSAVGSII